MEGEYEGGKGRVGGKKREGGRRWKWGRVKNLEGAKREGDAGEVGVLGDDAVDAEHRRAGLVRLHAHLHRLESLLVAPAAVARARERDRSNGTMYGHKESTSNPLSISTFPAAPRTTKKSVPMVGRSTSFEESEGFAESRSIYSYAAIGS